MLGAGVVGLAALIAAAIPLSAGRELPHRWTTTQLGYSADAGLEAYTATGMALWSSASAIEAVAGGSDIRVVFGPLVGPVYHAHQAAQANLAFDAAGNITGCEVRVVEAEFRSLNEFGRQNVITHELGHCLGLDHSDVPGVMMNPRFYGLSSDDAETIRAKYPPAPQSAPAGAASAVEVPVAAATAESKPQGAPPPAGGAAAPPASRPPAQTSAPGGITLEPRPYAGSLASGWNYIAWAGPEADPAECGCDAIARHDGAGWKHWRRVNNPFLPNTVMSLEPGKAYWVYVP
jgi:hypothetical protein